MHLSLLEHYTVCYITNSIPYDLFTLQAKKIVIYQNRR